MIDNIVLHYYIMSGSVIYLFQSLSKLIEDLFLSKLEESFGEENATVEDRRGRRRRECNRIKREKRQEEKRMQ